MTTQLWIKTLIIIIIISNRFSKAKSYNCYFHKNDVIWPLNANGQLGYIVTLTLASITRCYCSVLNKIKIFPVLTPYFQNEFLRINLIHLSSTTLNVTPLCYYIVIVVVLKKRMCLRIKKLSHFRDHFTIIEQKSQITRFSHSLLI